MIIVIVIVVLALLGMPLFAVFGAAAMVGLDHASGNTASAVGSEIFGDKFLSSVILPTIPLFTFAGYLMAESKAPQRMVKLAEAWLGWVPGGLAMVALGACAFFTAFTGGSGITIVAIGGLLYPALRGGGFDEKFSLGMVTTGGSLGLLFPPSVPVILYAVVATQITTELGMGGIMVEKLFITGAIPGLLTVFMIWVYAVATDKKMSVADKIATVVFTPVLRVAGIWAFRIAKDPRDQSREAVRSFLAWLKGGIRALFVDTLWEAILPLVLIVGIVSGALRIHEAAAFTAAYVLVVAVFIYRDVPLRDLGRIIRESMTLVGAIMLILVTAIGFTWFLVYVQATDHILEWIQSFVDSKWTFLLMLNLFLIVVGMMMDIFSAIVVVVPLILPLAKVYGVDPYHLGIIFLLNLEIGYLTPPVGLNLFISSFRFGKPVTLLYKAVLPFIGVLILALAFTTYVPALSLWLPSQIHLKGDDPTPAATAAPNEGGGFDDLEGGGGFDDLEGGGGFDDLEGGGGFDDLEGGGGFDDLEGGGGFDDLEGGGGFDDLEPDLDPVAHPVEATPSAAEPMVEPSTTAP